jgi:Na+/melibiose symporter-like transporter
VRSTTPAALSRVRLACFASPQLPLAALSVPITTYLPPYYAGELGLGLAAVGAVFFATKIWDMAIDPLLGALSDRLPAGLGRRRLGMLMGSPLVLLAGVLLFFPEAVLDAPPDRVYLGVGLAAVYVGFTLMVLSHLAWGAELTTDYHQRSRIQGALHLLQLIGMVLVLAAPAAIEQLGGSASDRQKVEAMGWFLVALLPVSLLLALWAATEVPSAPQPRIGLRRALEILATNRPLARILIADLMVSLPGAIRASLYVFFMLQIIESREWVSLIMLSYFLAGPIAVPLWLRISRRIGKHRAMAWGVLLHVVVTLGYLLAGSGDVVLFALLFFASGLVYAGTPFLLRAITADLAEADTLASGQQRTGLYYALITLTQKFGYAFGVGLGYPLLAWIGFSPQGENSGAALAGLRYLYVFIPVVSELLVVGLLYNFPLDEARQRAVRGELEARAGTSVG